MVWIGSVLLSAMVMLVTFLAPAAEIAVTSDSPPGFLLLWTRYSAHLAFVFLLLAFSASTLKVLVSRFGEIPKTARTGVCHCAYLPLGGAHLVSQQP